MSSRFAAECMACIVAKQERGMPSDWNEARRSEYLRGVMRIIVDADPAEGAPVVTQTISHLAAAHAIKPVDYTLLKRRYNALMLELVPRLRAEIQQADDPIYRGMQYARTANYIDFGTLADVSENGLLALIEKAQDEPLDAAEYARFRDEFSKAQSFVYLTDNCGEIVADMLLMEQLRAARPDMAFTAIVRGLPTINDATLDDAQMVGLDRVVDVIGNGNDIAGTWRDAMDETSRKRLDGADMILAKGQGNFETLNGCGLNIYYLFLCKCHRFERRFNMQQFQGVLANDRRLS